MIKIIFAALLIAVVTVALTGQAQAVRTYTLSGSVKYSSGVMPTTTVEARSSHKNRYVTTVRPDGTYAFYQLVPAEYKVTPKSSGVWRFKPAFREVRVRTANVLNVNFTALAR